MNGNGSDNKGEIKVIVRTLATLAVMCVLAECALAFWGKAIPPELNTLTGGLVATLAPMLVKTSATPSTPPEPTKPTGAVKVPEQTLETEKT